MIPHMEWKNSAHCTALPGELVLGSIVVIRVSGGTGGSGGCGTVVTVTTENRSREQPNQSSTPTFCSRSQEQTFWLGNEARSVRSASS